MKQGAYIRAGILFVVSVVIVFWGINYLKGKDLLTSEQPYYALYERIGGLSKSSPVTINGFQVGQVRNIRLSEEHPGWIEVKFSISHKTIHVPVKSKARIYSTDLMGTKGIALDFSDETLLCQPGDTLMGSIEGDLRDQVNAQMLPLKHKIEQLMASMDTVLSSIQNIFSEDNQANLAQSFTSINGALNNLESASRFLDTYIRDESQKVTLFLSNIDSLSRSLKNQSSNLQNFIANMNRFSDTLANVELVAAVQSIQSVLDDLQKLTVSVASGEGTLGQLISSDSLYLALLSTNNSLNRLIEDIRINPGKYVKVALTDRSKVVYSLNDSELTKSLAGEGVSDYYVCFLQSPTPIDATDPVFTGISRPEYIQVGSLYYYYNFYDTRIEPCLRKLDKLRKSHPSAAIYTWLNGKWTRLQI